ncbi:ankyrin repeat, SAM and basic leucine zipper domain-containing protein 1 isoform X4 [Pseudophryne corroboree]|uniref:ankyrin repeat, SAM and basic leucine zipper domain-containing protein 1 isoform X4 n=1 Tax=Pseudophryne corroboree TaxID=495146 RepID=UPI0030821AD8
MAAVRYHAVPGGGESSDSDDAWEIGDPRDQKENMSKQFSIESTEDALKNALNLGNVKLVEELLDSGLNVDCSFRFGWTPLMYAVSVANLKMVRVLLDRGANASFERDKCTVLMSACSAYALEENIVKCVELLLSRNVNPNVCCRNNMTALMLAARAGHTQVVALLVAYGADINAQDKNGYTIFSILSFSGNLNQGKNNVSKESVYRYLKIQPESSMNCTSSYSTSSDLDVFLHGLGLEHLTDLFKENDVTLRQLLSLEEIELQKAGVTDTEDCKKIMLAVKEIQVEETKLEMLTDFSSSESSSDELFAFLLKLNRQCTSITHAVESVNNQIPLNAQKVVLELDSSQNFPSVCEDIVTSVTDLRKEVCRLQNLLHKFQQGQRNNPCRVPPLKDQRGWRWGQLLKMTTLAVLGLGFFISVVQIRARNKVVL